MSSTTNHLQGIIPYNAINFATFDSVQHFVRGDAPKLTHIQALFVGAFSGGVAATGMPHANQCVYMCLLFRTDGLLATYPLDLLRRRMQMRSELGGPKIYTGVVDAVIKIWAQDGFRGFFRGLIPCYLKVGCVPFAWRRSRFRQVIPSNAIGFAVYDFCKRLLKFESGSAPSSG
jgi:solute carrier family 25 phosphate transporter 23/24/25/41